VNRRRLADRRRSVFDTFTDSDELDRDTEVAFDGDDDPPRRRPVEFGEHDARHVGGGEELSAWLSAFCPVVASSTMKVSTTSPGSRSATRRTLLSSSNRFVLFERRRRIGEHDVRSPRGRSPRASCTTDPGPRPRPNERCQPRSWSPTVRVDRPRPLETCRRRPTRRCALVDQSFRQFADGGGLADTVHAHEEPHRHAPLGARGERSFGAQRVEQSRANGRRHAVGAPFTRRSSRINAVVATPTSLRSNTSSTTSN